MKVVIEAKIAGKEVEEVLEELLSTNKGNWRLEVNKLYNKRR